MAARMTSALVAVAAVGLAALLAGCDPVPAGPEPGQTAGGPSSAPTGAATDAPVPTAFDPDGSAESNLAFFNQVAEQVAAKDGVQGGREFVDALVAAGFPKEAMQLTNDQTTINLPAASVEFSVQVGSDCLIGQQMEDGSYSGIVLPVTAAGTCLIGTTRPIDW